jgi:flagellar biosynthesis protein FlhA
MAIDADLSAGLIDEADARTRREKIRREADMYGSLDGAAKFVKGEAILGVIIVLITSVGGLIIGSIQAGLDIGDAANLYVVATIGDGLSSQLPALMISAAMGLIVTKAVTDASMGVDLSKQLSGQPTIMIIVGGVLALIAFIFPLSIVPRATALLIAAGLAFLGFSLTRSRKRAEEAAITAEVPEVQQEAAEARKAENVVSLLRVDPIELEIGYGLIPLADPAQGGDLLDRMVMIRRQCAVDLGLIVPVIRLRDNIQFAAGDYMVKLRGEEVASGEVMLDHYLAMGPEDLRALPGADTLEPAFGLPAKWIAERDREQAELMGCTLVDPPSVIATHMTEVLRRHAHELLGRQQTQTLIDNLKQSQASLVDEVIPKQFSLGEVQRVLSNLLREGVSIRDMGTILETMGDYGSATRDPDLLTEYVRQALRRSITKKYVPDRKARVITLDPVVENTILDNIRQSEHGSYVSLEADTVNRVFQSLKTAIERVSGMGLQPIVLTSPVVRFHFKRLVEQFVPDLIVLSYNELEQNVAIQADGIVRL